MAASGAPVRQPRRGPAPIASFDHDISDESSPETKQAFRLPEILEDSGLGAGSADVLAPPEPRARSLSTPAAGTAAGALAAPPAPRIDISRASSSSHHDSRDSSPELALFAGAAPAGGELGFREDGALDLRSSTEELAFLEPAPGEPRAPPPAPPSRRHSRKDSQGSEAALLGVSGRTSRLSSVGSQCSAHSALSAYSRTSRVSRLSVASGASRSPSPHRMLLETSFCGPKPIETDPEICAAAVEERLLEMAKLGAVTPTGTAAPQPPPPSPAVVAPVVPAPVDARDRREVRTEATVERATPRPPSARPTGPPPSPAPGSAVTTTPPASTTTWVVSSPAAAPVTSSIITSPSPATAPGPGWTIPAISTAPAPAPGWTIPAVSTAPLQAAPDDNKRQKETENRVKAEERRARSRERRDLGESRTKNRSKDIIRIRLKPDSEYDDDDEDVMESSGAGAALKPATLELGARPARPADSAPTDNGGPATASQRKPSRDSRTPSPAGVVVSRKSSFCSLFKSRETIASPESPSDALRRKKSVNEGRSRSRSRDRSATPTSATKIKGSVLSLFKTPRKSATSPSPSSRDSSPVVQPQRQITQQPVRPPTRAEKLKYYEENKEGIIHIPLRTPPGESGAGGDCDARPASAPQQRVPPTSIAVTSSAPPSIVPAPTASGSAPTAAQKAGARSPSKPIQRTVLPDGSIIIPLRSPTEKSVEDGPSACAPAPVRAEERRPADASPRPASAVDQVSVASSGIVSMNSGQVSISPQETGGVSTADATPSPPPPVTESSKRRERFVFMTQVGSGDQVFSTQFSITKTPSVTSEISSSLPSFPESEAPPKEASASPPSAERAAPEPAPGAGAASPLEPHETPDTARDSSESEASSEAGGARGGNDVERRGLVVQESFEEELPYVPTTLPQERSLALPMVPVRERGDVHVARVERPRPPPPPVPHAARAPRTPHMPQVPPAPPTTPAPRVSATEADKIRIRLPRRPRTASASAPPRPERARARTGSDGTESRPKAEWIDFEEVPERRKQPKRIQTLPSAAAASPARDLVFSYVEPEECRCECHARADDETPLLDTDARLSSSPVEVGAGEAGGAGPLELSVQLARPFTGDLGLSREPPPPQERQ